jgi:hypothetical protein
MNYFDNSERDDVLSGGVKTIPIDIVQFLQDVDEDLVPRALPMSAHLICCRTRPGASWRPAEMLVAVRSVIHQHTKGAKCLVESPLPLGKDPR